ncbi:MAG: hypothetical protein ACOC5K_00075 [Chloroflexota bacterium]
MSKLTDKLHELGRAQSAPIGFGPRRQETRKPSMLVIGSIPAEKLSGDGLSEKLDAVIVTDAESLAGGGSAPGPLEGKHWGVALSDASGEQLDALKEAGCDFVLAADENGPAVLLREDDMSRGMETNLELSEDRARALECLPTDFLTLETPDELWPLKLSGLIRLQSVIGLVSKHILLRVDHAPAPDELAVLRDLPVDALIFDLERIQAGEIASARERIEALPPRKPRSTEGRRDAVLPSSHGSANDEDWDDDDDDDVW